MLVTLFAALAIAHTQEKAPLPNGAAVYAERMPDARGFTLVFFVSSFGHPEAEGRSGFRHLLEHFVAKGTGRDLNDKLEAKGMTLNASTLPDGIRFEIEGPAGAVPDAIIALKDLLAFTPPTQEEISKEAQIIAQEAAIRSPGSALSAALRSQAFAIQGDMMGKDEDLAKATPDALKGLYDSLFRPEALCVAVVGDIMEHDAVQALTALLQPLKPKGRVPNEALKAVPQTQEAIVGSTNGSARGAVVGSFGKSETLATIAAALAIASEVHGAHVVVGVSPIGGVVSIVHPVRGGLDDVDRLVQREPDRLLVIAKSAVRLYASTTNGECREKAEAFAQMLLTEPYFRMQDVIARAGDLTQADIAAALQKFLTANCVMAGGTR